MKKRYQHNDRDIAVIWGSYHNELVDLQKLISFKEANTWNRNYIRTFVSLVEGISYRVRQNLLEKGTQNLITLDIEEIIILKEKLVELNNKGIIKIRDKFFPFESMFLFTFKIYARVHKKENLLKNELSKIGYSKLKNVVEIRNRITHPKAKMDVDVSGHEVKLADDAFEWFHNFGLEMFKDDILVEIKEND